MRRDNLRGVASSVVVGFCLVAALATCARQIGLIKVTPIVQTGPVAEPEKALRPVARRMSGTLEPVTIAAIATTTATLTVMRDTSINQAVDITWYSGTSPVYNAVMPANFARPDIIAGTSIGNNIGVYLSAAQAGVTHQIVLYSPDGLNWQQAVKPAVDPRPPAQQIGPWSGVPLELPNTDAGPWQIVTRSYAGATPPMFFPPTPSP